MKTSLILYSLALSIVTFNTVIAQKTSSFEYTVLKDNKPFDIENDVLSYADSNSVLQVLVHNPKLSKSITWEVARINMIAKTDSKMLFQKPVNSSSVSLQVLMSKLANSNKTMRDKQLSHKPGLLLEIERLHGKKGEKEKTVKTSYFIELKMDEGIE